MEALPSLLGAILSPDNAQRTVAEHQIDTMSATPGFLPVLVQLCCQSITTAQTSVLMVALSVLKQKMTPQSSPHELCAVAKALMEQVLFNPSLPPSLSGGGHHPSSPVVKQTAAVITKAVVLLESQMTSETDDESAMQSTTTTAATAAQNLSALLPFAFNSMSSALSPVMTPLTTATSLLSSEASEEGDPATSALPLRVLVLLQEMAEGLPDHNCVARNDYLLDVVPAMFALAVHGTPPSLLQAPVDTMTASPAGCIYTGPWATRVATRLRLQVAAAQVLTTLYAHRAAVGKLQVNLHEAVPPLPDTEPFRALPSRFVLALQQGLLPRLTGLRLATVATDAQRILSEAGDSTPSLPINILLLSLKLECQLLSLVPLAAKSGLGSGNGPRAKKKGGKVTGSVKPEAAAFSPDVLKEMHQALEQDVSTYHEAQRLHSTDADDDDGDDGMYERVHGDAEPLDRQEALQSLGALIRKCTELRWRFLESGTAATATPVKGARTRYLAMIHSAEGLTNDQMWFAEANAYYQLFIEYAFLSAREAALWEADPNAFLRKEDEKDLLWAVRDVVAQVDRRNCRVVGSDFVHVALTNLQRILLEHPEAVEPLPAQLRNDPQRREAAMFLLENVLRTSAKDVVLSGNLNYAGLMETLLTQDVGSGNAVVAARALVLVGTLLRFLSKARLCEGRGADELCVRVLLPTVALLPVAAGTPPLLRACACTLLLQLIELAPVSALRDAFAAAPNHPATSGDSGSAQRALLQLLLDSSSTSGEMLYTVLDVLARWLTRLRAHFNTVDGLCFEPTAHAALFACWREHLQDPNVGEAVLGVFAEYIRSPAGDDAFIAELPWLQHVLLADQSNSRGRGATAELCSVPVVMQVLAQVFLRGSERAANATAAAVLDVLCVLLLSTDESAILDASSSCLATLLRRCPQAESVQVRVPPSLLLRAQHREDGVDLEGHDFSVPSAAAHIAGLEEERVLMPLTTVLLAIVFRMLAPQRSEVSLLNVSNVLVAIVEHAPHFSGEEVHQFIDVVAHRLETVRTPSVVQQLVAPLPVLLKMYPDAFLATLRQTGMLERTFALWLPQVRDFFGKRDVLQSCEALVGLLLNWDRSGLEGVMIPWQQPDRHQPYSLSTGPRGGASRKGKRRTEQLPLSTAIFLAIGQAIVVLFDMLEGETWEEMEKAEQADADAGGLGMSGAHLWQESDSDGEDDFGDGDGDDDDDDDGEEINGANVDECAGDAQHGQGQGRVEALEAAKQQLRPIFGAMPPLLNQYGAAVTQFFTTEELSAIHEFFQLILGS